MKPSIAVAAPVHPVDTNASLPPSPKAATPKAASPKPAVAPTPVGSPSTPDSVLSGPNIPLFDTPDPTPIAVPTKSQERASPAKGSAGASSIEKEESKLTEEEKVVDVEEKKATGTKELKGPTEEPVVDSEMSEAKAEKQELTNVEPVKEEQSKETTMEPSKEPSKKPHSEVLEEEVSTRTAVKSEVKPREDITSKDTPVEQTDEKEEAKREGDKVDKGEGKKDDVLQEAKPEEKAKEDEKSSNVPEGIETPLLTPTPILVPAAIKTASQTATQAVEPAAAPTAPLVVSVSSSASASSSASISGPILTPESSDSDVYRQIAEWKAQIAQNRAEIETFLALRDQKGAQLLAHLAKYTPSPIYPQFSTPGQTDEGHIWRVCPKPFESQHASYVDAWIAAASYLHVTRVFAARLRAKVQDAATAVLSARDAMQEPKLKSLAETVNAGKLHTLLPTAPGAVETLEQELKAETMFRTIVNGMQQFVDTQRSSDEEAFLATLPTDSPASPLGVTPGTKSLAYVGSVCAVETEEFGIGLALPPFQSFQSCVKEDTSVDDEDADKDADNVAKRNYVVQFESFQARLSELPSVQTHLPPLYLLSVTPGTIASPTPSRTMAPSAPAVVAPPNRTTTVYQFSSNEISPHSAAQADRSATASASKSTAFSLSQLESVLPSKSDRQIMLSNAQHATASPVTPLRTRPTSQNRIDASHNAPTSSDTSTGAFSSLMSPKVSKVSKVPTSLSQYMDSMFASPNPGPSFASATNSSALDLPASPKTRTAAPATAPFSPGSVTAPLSPGTPAVPGVATSLSRAIRSPGLSRDVWQVTSSASSSEPQYSLVSHPSYTVQSVQTARVSFNMSHESQRAPTASPSPTSGGNGSNIVPRATSSGPSSPSLPNVDSLLDHRHPHASTGTRSGYEPLSATPATAGPMFVPSRLFETPTKQKQSPDNAIATAKSVLAAAAISAAAASEARSRTPEKSGVPATATQTSVASTPTAAPAATPASTPAPTVIVKEERASIPASALSPPKAQTKPYPSIDSLIQSIREETTRHQQQALYELQKATLRLQKAEKTLETVSQAPFASALESSKAEPKAVAAIQDASRSEELEDAPIAAPSSRDVTVAVPSELNEGDETAPLKSPSVLYVDAALSVLRTRKPISPGLASYHSARRPEAAGGNTDATDAADGTSKQDGLSLSSRFSDASGFHASESTAGASTTGDAAARGEISKNGADAAVSEKEVEKGVEKEASEGSAKPPLGAPGLPYVVAPSSPVFRAAFTAKLQQLTANTKDFTSVLQQHEVLPSPPRVPGSVPRASNGAALYPYLAQETLDDSGVLYTTQELTTPTVGPQHQSQPQSQPQTNSNPTDVPPLSPVSSYTRLSPTSTQLHVTRYPPSPPSSEPRGLSAAPLIQHPVQYPVQHPSVQAFPAPSHQASASAPVSTSQPAAAGQDGVWRVRANVPYGRVVMNTRDSPAQAQAQVQASSVAVSSSSSVPPAQNESRFQQQPQLQNRVAPVVASGSTHGLSGSELDLVRSLGAMILPGTAPNAAPATPGTPNAPLGKLKVEDLLTSPALGQILVSISKKTGNPPDVVGKALAAALIDVSNERNAHLVQSNSTNHAQKVASPTGHVVAASVAAQNTTPIVAVQSNVYTPVRDARLAAAPIVPVTNPAAPVGYNTPPNPRAAAPISRQVLNELDEAISNESAMIQALQAANRRI